MVRTFTGRPAIIKKDGWTIMLSVHDAAFMEERSRRRAELAQAHPDKGGTAHKFNKLMENYREWLRKEWDFYLPLGLKPPMEHRRPFSYGVVKELVAAEDETPRPLCKNCKIRPVADSRKGGFLSFCSRSCSNRDVCRRRRPCRKSSSTL
jgi:hypothetical protein